MQVRLHYILADDTIEVLPTYNRNCGRDKLTMLLKRSKVMKKVKLSDDFGLTGLDSLEGSLDLSDDMSRRSSITFEEGKSGALGNSSVDGGSVVTSNIKLAPSRPYHWTDLKIGDMIPVAAMNVLLIDADGFTRKFFASKGIQLGEPIVLEKKKFLKQEIVIPPHTGFGSEIDSLVSCKGSLIPLPPHKDGAKLKLYQGMILRYLATLDSTRAADESRTFIVQVHLEDDTIQVLEPPKRNSGHKGGVFLNRGTILAHDDEKVIGPHDIFIGATVSIYGNNFIIHDADEYTLRYMEESSKLWVHSALPLVVEKINRNVEVLRKVILTTPGLRDKQVTVQDVDDLLKKANITLVKQEIITLFRVLDPRKSGIINLTKILKFLQ